MSTKTNLGDSVEWKLWAEIEPEANKKFVTLYLDGSGAGMYLRDEYGKYYDEEGHEMFPEYLEDNFLMWAYIPDQYTFWSEQAEQEPASNEITTYIDDEKKRQQALGHTNVMILAEVDNNRLKQLTINSPVIHELSDKLIPTLDLSEAHPERQSRLELIYQEADIQGVLGIIQKIAEAWYMNKLQQEASEANNATRH